MKPTFGGAGVSGSVADRINQMRERSGLPSLEPEQMDTEAITRQVQSDQGIGEYSDADLIDYEDFDGMGESEPIRRDPPKFDAGPVNFVPGEQIDIPPPPSSGKVTQRQTASDFMLGAPKPKGLERDGLPVFATKQWYLYNFLVPLPYFAYTTYKFANKAALASKCDAQKNFLSEECTTKRLVEQSEHDYDVPASGSFKDVWTLYKKEAMWAVVWSGIGAGITGYHAYKRGNAAKSIGMYSLLGASVPIVGIGLALMQGFPRYRGPGQTKRSR